jgi:hypothetical protein
LLDLLRLLRPLRRFGHNAPGLGLWVTCPADERGGLARDLRARLDCRAARAAEDTTNSRA